MFANIFRAAASLAATALATELRKPETQEKLSAAAAQAAAKLRDPETAQNARSLALRGARELGRAIGNLKNR